MAWRACGLRPSAARTLCSSVSRTAGGPEAGAAGAVVPWAPAAPHVSTAARTTGGTVRDTLAPRARMRRAARRTRPMTLHLAEDVLRDQLLEVDGRFDLRESAAGGHQLVRASRADLDELLADETLRLDGGD